MRHEKNTRDEGLVYIEKAMKMSKQTVHKTINRKDILVMLVDAMVASMVALLAVPMVAKKCKIGFLKFTEM